MDFSEFQEVVTSALGDSTEYACGFGLSKGVFSATLTRKLRDATGEGAPRTSAVMSTNGVEAFFLSLDDAYEWREFDWEAEGQRESVATLVKLAQAYLSGRGSEVSQRTRLGRDRTDFVLVLEGETHVCSLSRSRRRE